MRNHGRDRLRRLLIPSLALLTGACGDPVERGIARIVEGGEGVEEARLELNMAKARAVEPLVRALDDRSLPVRARIDFVQALYRLHLREEQPAILPALLRALADPEPGVRAAAARALGNLRRPESVDPLLQRLSVEEDPLMQGEILQALELMCLDDNRIDLSLFTAAQVDTLTGRLLKWAPWNGPTPWTASAASGWRSWPTTWPPRPTSSTWRPTRPAPRACCGRPWTWSRGA